MVTTAIKLDGTPEDRVLIEEEGSRSTKPRQRSKDWEMIRKQKAEKEQWKKEEGKQGNPGSTRH